MPIYDVSLSHGDLLTKIRDPNELCWVVLDILLQEYTINPVPYKNSTSSADKEKNRNFSIIQIGCG